MKYFLLIIFATILWLHANVSNGQTLFKEQFNNPPIHSDHRWGGSSLEDGTDGLQIYENGGATACYTYFTVNALQKLKRNSDAEKILHPILKSIKEGNFSGKCANGMSKDWKTWKGECWGYEGFLVDGYMVLLACLEEK